MSVVALSQFVGLMVSNRIAIRHGRESHHLSFIYQKYQKDTKYPKVSVVHKIIIIN